MAKSWSIGSWFGLCLWIWKSGHMKIAYCITTVNDFLLMKSSCAQKHETDWIEATQKATKTNNAWDFWIKWKQLRKQNMWKFGLGFTSVPFLGRDLKRLRFSDISSARMDITGSALMIRKVALLGILAHLRLDPEERKLEKNRKHSVMMFFSCVLFALYPSSVMSFSLFLYHYYHDHHHYCCYYSIIMIIMWFCFGNFSSLFQVVCLMEKACSWISRNRHHRQVVDSHELQRVKVGNGWQSHGRWHPVIWWSSVPRFSICVYIYIYTGFERGVTLTPECLGQKDWKDLWHESLGSPWWSERVERKFQSLRKSDYRTVGCLAYGVSLRIQKRLECSNG